MARFMADQLRNRKAADNTTTAMGSITGVHDAFPAMSATTPKDAAAHRGRFPRQSRNKLQELIAGSEQGELSPDRTKKSTRCSKKPSSDTRQAEKEDAQEIVEWMSANVGVEVPEDKLTGATKEAARQILWNAFDAHYRPEMRTMERNLLLNQLDTSWKNHLYTMDHLRAGYRPGRLCPGRSEDRLQARGHEGIRHHVGGCARQGHRHRLPHGGRRRLPGIGLVDRLGRSTSRVTPMRASRRSSMRGQQDAAIANSQKRTRSRSRSAIAASSVGRNDPCPCGSGKKYKNCHMRQQPQAG